MKSSAPRAEAKNRGSRAWLIAAAGGLLAIVILVATIAMRERPSAGDAASGPSAPGFVQSP